MCIWRCEHAWFCVEVFYSLCIYILIHSFTSKLPCFRSLPNFCVSLPNCSVSGHFPTPVFPVTSQFPCLWSLPNSRVSGHFPAPVFPVTSQLPCLRSLRNSSVSGHFPSPVSPVTSQHSCLRSLRNSHADSSAMTPLQWTTFT